MPLNGQSLETELYMYTAIGNLEFIIVLVHQDLEIGLSYSKDKLPCHTFKRRQDNILHHKILQTYVGTKLKNDHNDLAATV